MSRPFTHLHCHSEYSLLDGAARISTLVHRAKDLGMNSLSLTDHGNLSGSLEFYRECKSAGVNPILGIEAYTCSGSRHQKSQTASGRPSHPHLTLLAKNRIGFQNLIKLSSMAYNEGFYYSPRMDREILAKYSEGIICLSGCISGELQRRMLAGDDSQVCETINWYHGIYGDNYYLEVMASTEHQRQTLQNLLDLSEVYGIPAICTSDVHYVDRDDHDLQDVMLCISTGRQRSDPGRMQMTDKEYYLKSPEEMYALVPDRPDIFARSQQIADSIDIDLDLGKKHFPSFAVPDDKTPAQVLKSLCYAGIRRRYGAFTQKLFERINHELYVIDKLGFSTYFLIIHDIAEYCRNHNIICSARGSAAGALACYSLGISHVCPFEYGLLFERFLDMSRREPPDIDLDVEKYRRGEVIQYLKTKYGDSSVAQIGTFGTMAARAAIKDVARVHGIDQSKVQVVCDMISTLPGTTIDCTLEDSAEFLSFYNKSKTGKFIIDMARRLEGMIRNSGTHAAAIVIAPGEMTDYVPTMISKDAEYTVTQWAMEDVEAAGIIKFDLLGLKTLDVVSMVMARVGLTEIPWGDEAAFKLLEKGYTEGVFQLGGWGMRKTLMQLQPKTVEEISHVIAIFRPGPIDSGMLDHYVSRRNGKESTDYPHPLLEEVLGSTSGIAVYQEQLMNLAYRVAGIPLSDAYSLIKAVSKKKKTDLVDKYKDRFITGTLERGLSQADAQLLWDQIEAAGRYSFNKSHSVAYAAISYQTAYLKAHYTAEFMAATMTIDIPNRNHKDRHGDDVDAGIKECRKMGIMVVSPDINTGGPGFSKDTDHSITFALDAIKGVGTKAAQAIQDARGDSPFTSLDDFYSRVDTHLVTKGAVSELIKAGAFNAFENSSEALDRMPAACKIGKRIKSDKQRGQLFLNLEEPQ